MSKKTVAAPGSEQLEEFERVAREVGAAEDPASFDKMLGKIAKAPTPKTVQRQKKSKKDK